MGWFIFWIIMGVVVAIVAGSKGYSSFAWFLYGALIWPVALVHILVKEKRPAAAERAASKAGLIKCPFCAEMIKAEAKVCRYCGRDLPSDSINGDQGAKS